RTLLLVGGLVATTTLAFLGTRALVLALIGPEAVRVVDVATVLAIVALVLPAQAVLGRAIDRFVLGRRAHLWNDLRLFLTPLSPEAGAATRCRQALAEGVRGLRLAGAAVVLRAGEAIGGGALRAEPPPHTPPRG